MSNISARLSFIRNSFGMLGCHDVPPTETGTSKQSFCHYSIVLLLNILHHICLQKSSPNHLNLSYISLTNAIISLITAVCFISGSSFSASLSRSTILVTLCLSPKYSSTTERTNFTSRSCFFENSTMLFSNASFLNSLYSSSTAAAYLQSVLFPIRIYIC